ncbi:MAG: putative toxin-antitoxin system toxin component, PIN family [Coriobacteriia bacterium]
MTRLRVLFDTNVLISAVLFGGVPGEIVDAARDGAIDGVVSLHILGELREVLTRERFGVDEVIADALVEEIAESFEVTMVERASAGWSADPDDDPVVEAALLSGVSHVVTGDRHLLALVVRDVLFVTPGEMLALLR